MEQILPIIKAKAIGQFLAFYHSDLVYIQEYRKFEKGDLSIEWGANNEFPYSGYSYIDYFGLKRKVKAGKRRDLWRKVKGFSISNCPCDVDKLASLLKRSISNGKSPSLASKVLLLKNPLIYIPYDSRVKAALGEHKYDLTYEVYHDKLMKKKDEYSDLVDEMLEEIKVHTAVMENSIKGISKQEYKTIRRNRMLDKLLWVRGSEK